MGDCSANQLDPRLDFFADDPVRVANSFGCSRPILRNRRGNGHQLGASGKETYNRIRTGMTLSRALPAGVDLTESSIEPSRRLKAEILSEVSDQSWRLYPARQPTQAVTRLATLWGVDEAFVRISSGADDAVNILTQSAVQRDQTVVFPGPSYPGYKRAVSRQKASFLTYPAQANLDEVVHSLDPVRGALIFFTYPGNPFGSVVPNLLKPAASKRVVVDSTYLNPFSEVFRELVHSAVALKISVIFSLSKLGGLAGLRLGGIVHASSEEAAEYDQLTPSFPLDYVQLSAWEIISRPHNVKEVVEREMKQIDLRNELVGLIARQGVPYWEPVAASFVTVRFTSKLDLATFLRRYPDLPGKRFATENCFRITANRLAVMALAE